MSWADFETLRSSNMGRSNKSKYVDFVTALKPGEVQEFTDYERGANMDGIRSSVLSAATRAGLVVKTTLDNQGRLLVGRPPSTTGDHKVGKRPAQRRSE